MQTIKTVGVVGLGNMGRGMAANLIRAGYRVLGHDAAPGVAQGLSGQGLEVAASLPALCAQAELVLLSLPTSAVVEAVVFGDDGLARHLGAGRRVLDTTTADPLSTRRVAAALAEVGVGFVDAPVSGGPAGAAQGTMTMVLGGDAADIAAMRPVVEAISARQVHVGPVGAGHITKLLNNMLTGIHLLASSEAVRAARAAGIDAGTLIEALNGGSGRNSATLTNYPSWILNQRFDSGFTMKLMRKDIGLASALFAQLGTAAPVAAEAARLWTASAASIDDAQDFNRIVEFLAPTQPH